MKVYPRCLLLFCVFVAFRAWGDEEQTCTRNELLHIESIEISGNRKTKTAVIERELEFHQQEKVCESQIKEGVQRIKDTGLFSSVSYSILPSDQPKSNVVKITVEEKWTTIPIVKVNSGGGISQYTLGVYDPNIFGEFLEAGAQYENLGGASSGVVWFKNPRLFSEHQGIDLQYWNTRRIRIKYDQEAEGPEITRGFLHERERFYADYFRELSPRVVARVSVDYNKDNFSTKILPDKVLDKLGPNPVLPSSTELVISKFGLELGKVEGDPQSLRGHVFGVHVGYAHSLDGNADPFVQGDVSFSLFKLFLPRWQYAQRLHGGITSTKVLQYWYYLGGLDRIRGFADNRFAGRQFALSNSEIRYLAVEKPSVLIQIAGFLDFASIGEETSDLTTLKAASVGSGIRFILPKFYRFVVRLDYAKPLIKTDTVNWSFGVQQFF